MKPTEVPEPLDGLPTDALAFIRQALDQGNAVLQVLHPPPDVHASVYVLLARPCSLPCPDPSGRSWAFGSLAPGLPAVVVLGADGWTSDPTPPPAANEDMAPQERGHDAMSRVRRFERGMNLDYEAWREGSSYDLAAVDEATPPQRARMLELLLDSGLNDWRDIEAVYRIGGRAARRALRRLWRCGSSAQRMDVLRHVPGFVSETARAAALVQALSSTGLYGGLSQCLDEVEDCHPPEVIDALWAALQRPEGEVAVHCAAMLAWLHGLADEPFDWQQRPFFLRFGSDDPAERSAAQRELRQRCGMETVIPPREGDRG